MKLFLYIGIITGLLTACESPLSDMILSDPSLLSPHIELKRVRNPYNQIIQTVEVLMYDQNGNLVELQQGGISMDKQNLELKYNGWGGPYYVLGGNMPLFEPGSHHTISITLGNGKTYNSHITLPLTQLTKLILPPSHYNAKDLMIQWEGVDNAPKLLLWSGSNASEYHTGCIPIPDSNLLKGTYLLPKEELSFSGKTIFDLQCYNYGTVDSNFTRGTIAAYWVVEAACIITE